MRIYALILLASCALAARAATIPDGIAEKKIVVVPEKVPSDQELNTKTNTINDVDNKLRIKPVDIPVQVIVDNVGVKSNDVLSSSDDVVRSPIDLNHPGPPQRQEHETQNPEYDATEQKVVQVYKQSINDAQTFLRQGFQGVSDGIQNLVDNNQQIQLIQRNIANLHKGFYEQIDKLNSTLQSYIKAEKENPNNAGQETNNNLRNVELGLDKLKSDFVKGVNTLAEGVEVYSSLKQSDTTSGSAPTPPANPAPPTNILLDYINRFQNSLATGMNNIQQSLNSYVTQAQTQVGNFLNPPQPPQPPAVPSGQPPWGTQADTPAGPPPAQPAPTNPFQQFNPWQTFQNTFNNIINPPQAPAGSPPAGGFASLTQAIQNIQNQIVNFFQPTRPDATPAVPSPSYPSSDDPKPVAPANQPIVPPKQPEVPILLPKPQEPAQPPKAETPAEPAPEAAPPANPIGPIRQILQNNPISKGIAGAVQRLQQSINPEKPVTPEKAVDHPAAEPVQKLKGHSSHSGDNHDIPSGVETPEPSIEAVEVAPVVEPKKIEVKEEEKKEVVVEKTE